MKTKDIVILAIFTFVSTFPIVWVVNKFFGG